MRLCASGVLRGSRDWPPASQVYSNPQAPPPWMLAPGGWAPALSLTPPAPLAPGAMVPADPFVVNAAYHEELQAGLAHQMYGSVPTTSGGGSGAWPPSPPDAPPAALSGVLGMRPLTLFDAKGAEYATDNPTLSKS